MPTGHENDRGNGRRDDTEGVTAERRRQGHEPVTPSSPTPEPAVPTPEPTPPPLHAEEIGGSAPSRVAAPSSGPTVATVPQERVVRTTVVHERPPTPVVAAPSVTRGWLVPIGGRLEDPAIITRFIDLCGPDAHVVVVPTASNQPDTGPWYQHLLRKHGAARVDVLRLQRRGDHVAAEQLDAVRRASGVFFTGGNQLKLATSIIGTPLATLLRQRHAEGLNVAGTSAGASFLSAHMIAFGQEGAVPHAGMVVTCGGLGLTEQFIIDQHFRERHRLGRLLTAVAYNPFLCGLGVDENTAAFIAPDGAFEVMGEGAVTVVDPASLDITALLEAMPGTVLDLPGMRVDVVSAATEGARPSIPG